GDQGTRRRQSTVVPGAHATATTAYESPRWEREGQEEGMRAAAALLHHTAAGMPLPSLLLLPPLPPQIDGQPFCSLAHEVAAMAAGSTRGRPLTAVFGGEGRRCGGGCNGDARRWRR
ncbi:Os12g0509900, partial [Oryza sativa Japonica Group]